MGEVKERREYITRYEFTATNKEVSKMCNKNCSYCPYGMAASHMCKEKEKGKK